MDNQILSIVLEAIHGIGEMEDNPQLLNPDDKLRLFGGDGVLDSVGVVMLITEVEEQVEEQLGVSITLADDRAMSQKTSPFRSVKTLTHYLKKLLDEEQANKDAQ